MQLEIKISIYYFGSNLAISLKRYTKAPDFESRAQRNTNSKGLINH